MKSIGIMFSNRTDRQFTAELRREVRAYFEDQGISQKANGWMVFKTVCMVSMLLVPYVLILTGAFSPGQMLGLCVVIGLGIAGVGFSVMHDALHGAYSSSPRVNAALGGLLDVMGGSSYIWKLRHNNMHHTYTNIHGADVDVEVAGLVRLSPGSKHLPFQRFQAIYAPFVYSLATLHWTFVKDFRSLTLRELGPFREIEHSRRQVAVLLGMRALSYFCALGVPLLVLDITGWQLAAGFVTAHLTAGLILTIIFQLAHVVEGPSHFASTGDEMMPDAWMVHQLKTTANFARGNRLLSWYVGGLNYQIEHHLFPRICSIHYPELSPIVRRVAEKHGLPYHYHPTFFAALRSHWVMLRRLSTP